MKNQILKNQILKRYLNLIFYSQSNVRITNSYYNFRCNICGDSNKNKLKKRGYILINKDRWGFKCHNCGAFMSAEQWLKEYYPNYYKMYVTDLLSDNKDKKESDESKIKKLIENKKRERRIEEKRIKKQEKEDVKYFTPIKNGKTKIFDEAIKFCKDRLIPENVWSKWFVSTKKKYGGRLIIPFYDNTNNIYYFQARTLTKQDPKYLNRVANKDNAIYNYFNIDKTKPVMILEGPIDSLFVDNSIAVLGTSISPELQKRLNKLNSFYLFDSDGAGVKTALKYLGKSKNVFVWKKFIKDYDLPDRDKWDMNEVYIYLKRKDVFTFKELEKYFTNVRYDRIWF